MISTLRNVVLMVVNRLLHHPHYPSISVFSRMITNVATLAWAVDVIVYRGELRGSPIPWVSGVESRWLLAIAFLLLALALFQSVWLFKAWPPLRWCVMSYGLIWAWWSFITWLSLLGVGSAAPNLKAGLVALFICSTFAWLSTPRHDSDDADHAPAHR